MPKKAASPELALGARASNQPLFQWLYREVRAAITDGRLKPGARLPATRALAAQYDLSRGTVLTAFDQLTSEGYICSRVGSGSYVSQTLPEKFFRAHKPKAAGTASPSTREQHLSRWGSKVRYAFPIGGLKRTAIPFQANRPALDLFPTSLWARLAGRRLRTASARLLGSADSAGFRPLREAVVDYLGSVRGVKCVTGQVVIVSGTQQTLDLIARLLLNPGDKAWVEDPGFPGAVAAIEGTGAHVLAVPVDHEGLKVDVGRRKAPDARLAYVTPAHQFPLGMSLSLNRRIALLDWASQNDGWVFEDDYDSEYRFEGRPLPALQSLDRDGRVIFAGSFNKMLFTTLRLGFVVLPERLVEPFLRGRSVTDRFTPALDQAVLCDFVTEGHFLQHLRRMREAYAERLSVLLKAVSTELPNVLKIEPIRAGLQTAAILSSEWRDEDLTLIAAQAGVEVLPLSKLQIRRKDINGLLLGFASASPASLRDGVLRLSRTLKSFHNAP
jgi:GntR family transcriptional regulator / MocR family aminotransferase